MKHKIETQSHRKVKMLLTQIKLNCLAILILKLWRSDPVSFSVPNSHIADLNLFLGGGGGGN